MERRSRISLDNPTFRGRLRSPRNVVRSVNGSTLTHGVRSGHPVDVMQLSRPPGRLPNLTAISGYNKLLDDIPRRIIKANARPDLPRQARSKVLRREVTPKKLFKVAPLKQKSHMPKVLVAMSALLFIGGLVVFFLSLRTDQTVKAQVKQLSNQAENGEAVMTDGMPSENDPPADIGAYSVAPDLPKLLTIEKIDVKARVRRVGVGANNTMKAPASIFDVGWYEGGAKPGENGTVVLDGHVAGPTKRGVFYSLRSLKTGDKIKLERGDGEVFTYNVVETKTYNDDEVDMPKVLTSVVPGRPGLNLITCSGRFNVRTNQYEQRYVVFAVQE